MEILNTIILLGAVQGIILSIFLFYTRSHPGTRFLAGLLFVLAYNGFETYNWSTGTDLVFFSLFPFVIIFGAGPCLLFYIRSLIAPDRFWPTKQVVLHFLPVILFGVFRMSMFALHWYALSSNPSLTSMLFEIEVWIVTISEPLTFISFLTYLTISWRHFREFQKNSTLFHSIEIHATRWAQQLLWCMWAVAVAWIFTISIPRVLEIDDPLDSHYYPIELSLVVLIYWITFAGYHRTKIVHVKRSNPQNTIDIETATRCENLLRNAMIVDMLYLDPELTVAKVSDHIKMPQKTISAVINQHLGQNFNDFINIYRVTEVKQRLLLQQAHLTIAGIALDCGFNSQATFQRAFKNIVKMSPKEFIAQHENQITPPK